MGVGNGSGIAFDAGDGTTVSVADVGVSGCSLCVAGTRGGILSGSSVDTQVAPVRALSKLETRGEVEGREIEYPVFWGSWDPKLPHMKKRPLTLDQPPFTYHTNLWWSHCLTLRNVDPVNDQ
jgi:hypothetical protein